MRKILFRGKNTINGSWVYGYYFVDEGINRIHSGHTIYPIHKNTVGQFTGLSDKNGKEIFEGDILQTETGIASVIWSDAAFALLSPGSEAVDWEHSSVYEKSLVIGNIHDKSNDNAK